MQKGKMQRERGVRGGSKKRLNPKGTGNGEKGGGCLFHLLRHKHKHKHKLKHACAHKHTQCAPASTQDRGFPKLLYSICCTHAAAWASLPSVDFKTDTREAANVLLARIYGAAICACSRHVLPSRQGTAQAKGEGRRQERAQAAPKQEWHADQTGTTRVPLHSSHSISFHPILSPCALYLSLHHCPPNSGVPSSPERVFAAAR
jgi:hypothetical protein